jgi:hypothetical protein
MQEPYRLPTGCFVALAGLPVARSPALSSGRLVTEDGLFSPSERNSVDFGWSCSRAVRSSPAEIASLLALDIPAHFATN